MPLELGGLALTPPVIGLIMGIYGASTGVFQIIFFPILVGRFGEKQVVLNGMMSCFPVFALFPIVNSLAKSFGFSPVVWVLVGLLFLFVIQIDTAFGQWISSNMQSTFR